VETIFENVAVRALMLETVMDPLGFTIAVELRRNCDACGAVIDVITVRLLVTMPFDAARFRVLIPGTVIASEKRRSAVRYVIYFSLNVIELASCRELVVMEKLLTWPCTKRLDPTEREFAQIIGPPIVAPPRISRLLAITEPLGVKRPPRVIMSPRIPREPREEIAPRTYKLLPVLRFPEKKPCPSTFIFP